MIGRGSRTSKSELVICTYRIKNAHEYAFLKLLARHWPTLYRQGLATAEPSVIYRGLDETRKAFFVEIFTCEAGAALRKRTKIPL